MKAVTLAALAAILTVAATPADAARRSSGFHPECNVTMPCAAPLRAERPARAHRTRIAAKRIQRPRVASLRAKKRQAAVVRPVTPAEVIAAPVKAITGAVELMSLSTIRALRQGPRSLAGVIEPLASKIDSMLTACPGSRVVSGVRHTRVRGNGAWSLHRAGRAVDMAGDPACLYRQLVGWPGGYTTDYHRVRHVHISYGGREHGLRFAHGSSKKKRYARAQRRFASAR